MIDMIDLLSGTFMSNEFSVIQGNLLRSGYTSRMVHTFSGKRDESRSAYQKENSLDCNCHMALTSEMLRKKNELHDFLYTNVVIKSPVTRPSSEVLDDMIEVPDEYCRVQGDPLVRASGTTRAIDVPDMHLELQQSTED